MSSLKSFVKSMAITTFPSLFKNKQLRVINDLNWVNPPNEEAELMLLPYLVPKDKLFFDIGANTGIYTTAVGNIIPGKLVYSFEPIAVLSNRLKAMHKDINVFQIALSNEMEEKQFKIPYIDGKEYKSRGTLQVAYKEDGETSKSLIKVQSDTLDNFVKKNGIKNIGFIKIDVEGHELHVIEGGTSTIREQQPILQIEIEQRHYDKKIKEIIQLIEGLGYNCYYLDVQEGSFNKLEKDPAEIQKSEYFKTSKYIHNFIFLSLNKNWDSVVNEINNDIEQARKAAIQ